MLPLLFVAKTSLLSHTIKSRAAMRDEYGKKGANSSLLARVSFEWKFGKSAFRGANVSSPPYTSPDATYRCTSFPNPSALSMRPTSSGVRGHLPCRRSLSGLLACTIFSMCYCKKVKTIVPLKASIGKYHITILHAGFSTSYESHWVLFSQCLHPHNSNQRKRACQAQICRYAGQ